MNSEGWNYIKTKRVRKLKEKIKSGQNKTSIVKIVFHTEINEY